MGIGPLRKHLENGLQPIRRDPDAVVPHSDERLIATALEQHPDGARMRRELGRIREQVGKDLPQPIRIADDGQRLGEI